MRIAIALLLALAANATRAQPVAEFYRGKRLTLVTGTAGAGAYDLLARVVSIHLPRFLPGAPSAIVQSMPGASHVKATEYMESLAPRDGATLGFVQPYVVLNKLLNDDARYRPERLTWIGRLLPLNQVGFAWHTSKVRSINDAMTTPISFGAGGATGPAAIVPWSLNRVLGTKFKVIMGYADDTAEFIALERGEIEGMGSVSYGSLARQPGWLAEKKTFPLYAISLKRLATSTEAPAIVELAKSNRDAAVLRILATMPTIGMTIIAPPDVPADRVAALRQASAAMAQDRAFQADMEKLDMPVEALGGEDVAKLVSDAMSASAETVRDLRDYAARKD